VDKDDHEHKTRLKDYLNDLQANFDDSINILPWETQMAMLREHMLEKRMYTEFDQAMRGLSYTDSFKEGGKSYMIVRARHQKMEKEVKRWMDEDVAWDRESWDKYLPRVEAGQPWVKVS
jgi:hypothetical protein